MFKPIWLQIGPFLVVVFPFPQVPLAQILPSELGSRGDIVWGNNNIAAVIGLENFNRCLINFTNSSRNRSRRDG